MNMETTINDLAFLHELRMRSDAYLFNLWKEGGRKKSADALVELFFGLTKAIQPALFVEAGAKTGEVSLRAREMCPQSRVLAFEANPYNFENYSNKFNHEEKQVSYLNLALSDNVGEITFNIIKSRDGAPVPRQTGMNSILERDQAGIEYERVTVPSTTLDTYLGDAESVALWVDVEGASRQVLGGGEAMLSKTDVMLVELEDQKSWKDQWSSTEALQHILSVGFIPIARDFEYRYQHNVLFISKRVMCLPEVGVNIDYYYSVLCRE